MSIWDSTARSTQPRLLQLAVRLPVLSNATSPKMSPGLSSTSSSLRLLVTATQPCSHVALRRRHIICRGLAMYGTVTQRMA